MQGLISFFTFLYIVLGLSACHYKETVLTHTLPLNCEYYSLQSAQCKDLVEMPHHLEPYKIIFIGDHHTEKNLHENIAKLITELSNSGIKVHLANEWFYRSDEKVLNAYTSNDINETEFIKQIQWKKRLKYYPYNSFQSMYRAIKETEGVLHGINLTKEEQKKISDQNLLFMTKEERNFNDSLDLNVPVHQSMVFPFLSHCHAPKAGEPLKECAKRMYRVQVAWDTKMAKEAYNISLTLKENEKLIVFAGAMHIENSLGIPLRFARLSNLPTVKIIPAKETSTSIEHARGDYLMFYKQAKKKD